MSKNTLEKIIFCRLELLNTDKELVPGLICRVEKTKIYDNILQEYIIRTTYYPSLYYAEVYKNKELPYITALEIIGNSKNSRNRLEIAMYEFSKGLKLKRAEIIKEKNSQIIDRKNITLDNLEILNEINKSLRLLTYQFCNYFSNNENKKTLEKINTYLSRINSIIKNILVEYVSYNFDKPLNNIARYPSFYGEIILIAPHPEILKLVSFYRK